MQQQVITIYVRVELDAFSTTAQNKFIILTVKILCAGSSDPAMNPWVCIES